MSNSPTQHEMVLKNETSCGSISPFKKNILCDIYAPLTFRWISNGSLYWLCVLLYTVVNVVSHFYASTFLLFAIHCYEHGKLFPNVPTLFYFFSAFNELDETFPNWKRLPGSLNLQIQMWKHPHKYTKIIWAPSGPVTLTHKINHHSTPFNYFK